jgi:S1-C subfamily serine protease
VTTHRASARRDADHSPRVSRGRITEWLTDHTFVADLDGLSGSSGGPVVDRNGRVVGLVQDVYPPSERERRPLHFAGGMACVAARPAFRRLLDRQGG